MTLTHDIHNPVTGDRLTFLASPLSGEGAMLRFRCTLPPHGAGAPLHVHDAMTETFGVEAGILEVALADDETRLLSAGESIAIAPGMQHGFRNPGAVPVTFVTTADPGKGLETFLRGMYALAAAGETDAAGHAPPASARDPRGAAPCRMADWRRPPPPTHGARVVSGRSPWLGAATIVLAVSFNIPYAVLATIFDYPAILRQPATEVLSRFAAGGTGLLLTWYAFALAALALVPLSSALAITSSRIAARPALAISAALAGVLAGITQAIGLVRWVFVMPDLARAATGDDPAAAEAAVHTFTLINAYGGDAVGEHLGQILTALFAGLLAALQLGEGHRATAAFGFGTAALPTLGTGEGLMLAAGHDGSLFSVGTIAGFLALTVWLIATGTLLLRRRG